MTRRRLLPRSTPAAERVDAAGLSLLLDRLAEQSVECHSVMVVRHGRVIAEGWWQPFTPERPHLLYSVTKSFTSIAVGLAIDAGLLALTDRVVDVLPDHVPAPVSDRCAQLTVERLLSMTTGHESDVLEDAWALEPDDLVKGFLRVTPHHPVGSRHAYNNPTSYVLARMVERVTGRSLPDLLQERLFDPLGVGHPEWERLRDGTTFAFHGLYLRTEDLAAFGEMLLRGGRWRGRQLVPREWVEMATRRQVATVQFEDGSRSADWLEGYGYHFWMSRYGYRADGAMGQYCLIIPDADLVVAMTAATVDMQAPLDAVWDCLLPAVGTAGRVTRDGELADRMRRLSLSRVAGDHRPDRFVRAIVDGAEASALPAGTSVAVTPERDGWSVRFDLGTPAVEVAVGHGGWRECAPLGRPVVAAGGWQGEDFVADLFVLTSPSRVRLRIAGRRATTTWNIVPLVGPDLVRQLRSPLVTRP